MDFRADRFPFRPSQEARTAPVRRIPPMKKSYLMSLTLAAVLAIPAVAQQNPQQNQPTTPPSDQPATQTAPAAQTPDQQAQTPSQPAQATAQTTATGQEPLKYERHEG